MAEKNYYPCNKVLRLAMNTPLSYSGFVRVNRELSKQNRRLYREGRVYRVKVDLDVGSEPTGYRVYAINNTWMLKKAWQKAKEKYDDANLAERNVFNGKLARWRDFSLDLDGMFTSSARLESTRFDINDNEQRLTAGEFYTSQVVNDGGTTMTFGLESTATMFNILQEFDLSGNMDTEPEDPSTQVPYDGLDTDLTDIEMADVSGNGNEPPYAANNSHYNYPLVKIGEISSTADGQKLSTGYFDAPFGYVIIVANAGHIHKPEGQSDLTVTVQSGDYKGVAAHSLME